jgi:hypothetical protein
MGTQATLPILPGLQFPGVDQQIAQFEGWGQAGVPATVNNNPGNLAAGPFAYAHGATGQNGNFATFPDVQTGVQAEDALVESYAQKGDTLSQMINAWAPATAPGNSQQSTQNYVNYVSGNLNVDPNTPVASITGPSVQSSGAGGGSTAGGVGSAILSGINQGLFGGALGGGTSSFDRIGAFVLGLIVIGAALFMFRSVRDTAVKVGSHAAKLGGAAAIAA